MSKSLVPAAVAAIVLAVGSFTAPSFAADAPAKPEPSKAARTLLKAAQDAQKAKNYAEEINKSKAVLALPDKNSYDAFVANQMLVYAYNQTGNTAEAVKAAEELLESSFLSPKEQTSMLKTLAVFAYQQKNYPKAIELGHRLIKGGGADAETYTVVGQSYYLAGNFAQAAKFINEYTSEQESHGQTPKELTLQLLRGAYDKSENNAGATDVLEKLVTYYPKPEYWNNLLYTLSRTQGISDRHTLHIFRLRQATKTLKEPSDFTEMAELAVGAGNPGEAKRVLEQGFEAGIFVEQRDKDRNTRLLESAKKSAAADLASLPKLDIDAKASTKSGDLDVALGGGYLSYGQNDKAVEALERGIGKGNLKSAVDAQILLGIAQLRVNNKAEAQKTFKSIKTDDPIYKRIAKLWTLYAQ
jgi:tetratricopeptide (TPR) repeat protein